MKNYIILLGILLVLVSCKEDLVKKPNDLIEKEVMVNIMYDLSLLDAMKYQHAVTLESNNINPSKYIFKKYKIDSLQFAQSNTYYAANYKEYKKLYEELAKKVEKNKMEFDSLVKVKNKKALLVKKAKAKEMAKKAKQKQALKKDSIAKAKKNRKL